MRRVALAAALVVSIGLSVWVPARGYGPLDAQVALKQYAEALRQFYSGETASLSMVEDARALKQHSMIKAQFMTDKGSGRPFPNLSVSVAMLGSSLQDNGDLVALAAVTTSFDRPFEAGGTYSATWVYNHALTIGLRNGRLVVIKDVFETELDYQLETPHENPLPAVLLVILSLAFASLAVYVFATTNGLHTTRPPEAPLRH